MSGILIVSGRPRPRRLTATIADAVPPPPRELPRINPVLPFSLVLATVGIVYFSGLLQVGTHTVQETTRGPAPPKPKPKEAPVVNRARILTFDKKAAYDGVSLVGMVRRLAFLVAKEPTTGATYQERLALLRAYFQILTQVDRVALFGTAEFASVEQVLQSLDGKTQCVTLDRLLRRLQATFH